MSNIKWIKLSTNMFEDEKIRLIEQMPDADTILVIWVKLLSQAGKTNASGYIYLSENIPYTDEMLATIFNRPLSTVRLALKTFQDFGMISINENNYIAIENWEKHQNVDALEKIRKQTRERVAKHRQKQKIENQTKKLHVTQEKENKSHNDNDEVVCNVTVTKSNATEEERRKKKEDIDKDIRDIVEQVSTVPFREIVDYLNQKADKQFRHTTAKTKSLINARFNEGFTLDDFKKVIDIKTDEWINDDKMKKFLRPETLFGTKFEGYLNQNTNGPIDDGYDYGF